ncbi:MAG TPA: response regulator [Vicinamibacterales bacterium]|nr:response regulator [Vicinamibacterales bacterium]
MPPTLLLADDSLTIQRVVSLTFADQPVRVVVAKDGQDAINRMAKERPDVVLADTNMPCVDGYELARWVREQPHLSTVPVLLLAGVADPVDEQRLHDSGANGVLEKPFEPSHVISRVKELLGLKGAPPGPAARLVTASDVKPVARRPEPEARQADKSAVERREPPSSAAGAGATNASARGDAPMVWPPADSTAEAAGDAAAREASGEDSEPYDMPVPAGDARDWFPDDPPQTSYKPSAALLGETPGRSEAAFEAPAAASAGPSDTPHRPGSGIFSRPRPSSAADVFESLLAAEQGQTAPPEIAAATAELTPAALDDLAARVVERLRPELQAMAVDMRSMVAELVQAAVKDALPGAVTEQVRESLVPAIRETVREVADAAIRSSLSETVATAVPAAIVEAVRGDGGSQVQAIVRETAERQVGEEIARIRNRAGA